MAASITATVTESVSMSGAPFSSTTVPISGEHSSIIERTTAAGATDTITGIAFDHTKCALLYFLSDANDCKVLFHNSGASIEIDLTTGVPYLLFGTAAIAAFLARDVTSLTIQNMNTANGVGNVADTDVHGRLVFTA